MRLGSMSAAVCQGSWEETMVDVWAWPGVWVMRSMKSPLRIEIAGVEFVHGVADAVARVVATVGVAGVRGCSHQDAEEFCFDWRGGKF